MCYAPTDVAIDEDKDMLQETIEETAAQDILLILGELNAKVAQDNADKL